jgi:hypothetical protein
MLFASFLASKWRWLAFAAAVIFAVLLITQGLDYASTWWARRQAAKVVQAAEASHDARAAGEPHHVHRFDSLLFTRIGQHRELAPILAKIKRADDSLHHCLPAAPALPAQPPRY